ncbi:MAG: DNA alkylation repair protein [Eubacteriales bacterium]|nr:DNA alkylation repair protein [Eubacteriales bacterium]
MSGGAIRERLLALEDTGYREFISGLLPTVDKGRIIGVRMPALRKLAQELAGTAEAEAFLKALPCHYLEESNLHGLLINRISDYEEAVGALGRFLPHVDNWATCDLLSPQAFKTRPAALYPGQIGLWLTSPHPYTVRFAVGQMMSLYLGEYFDPHMLEKAAGIRSDEYYVNMMVAWYFATALALQPEATLPWITQKRLPRWTHNKAIQKAVESYRIPPEMKAELKACRLKRR